MSPQRLGAYQASSSAPARKFALLSSSRLYWDTALSWHPANLRMLRSVVGMGQVLFGSDYPYLRRDLAVSCRHEVESSAELQANEARAVLAGNALKLSPRFTGDAATQTKNTA